MEKCSPRFTVRLMSRGNYIQDGRNKRIPLSRAEARLKRLTAEERTALIVDERTGEAIRSNATELAERGWEKHEVSLLACGVSKADWMARMAMCTIYPR